MTCLKTQKPDCLIPTNVTPSPQVTSQSAISIKIEDKEAEIQED